MFKIALPIPSEYGSDIKSFLSQMRIAITAAEKSYEQLTKNLDEEEKGNHFVSFYHPRLESYDSENDALDEIDPDLEKRQVIELEINQA